jgi:hypothetical protein
MIVGNIQKKVVSLESGLCRLSCTSFSSGLAVSESFRAQAVKTENKTMPPEKTVGIFLGILAKYKTSAAANQTLCFQLSKSTFVFLLLPF